MRARTASSSCGVITVSSTSTWRTPGSASTAEVTRRVISSRIGQPGTVRATVTVTRPRRMSTRRIMSSSTMLTCSSGSVTGHRASITLCSLSAIGSPLGVRFAGLAVGRRRRPEAARRFALRR